MDNKEKFIKDLEEVFGSLGVGMKQYKDVNGKPVDVEFAEKLIKKFSDKVLLECAKRCDSCRDKASFAISVLATYISDGTLTLNEGGEDDTQKEVESSYN